MRGLFYAKGTAPNGPDETYDMISFGFTLASAPIAHYIEAGTEPPVGCVGGTPLTPRADPGHLSVGLAEPYGAGVYVNASVAVADYRASGSWAVTAA